MKKIIFVFFFVLAVNALYSDNYLNEVVYNGNLTPLDNLIEAHQLVNFKKFELRILRNMIYAKYNYSFRDNYLREHFSQFSWYSGTENNVEHLLTYIDHRNINTIINLAYYYPVFMSFHDERIFGAFDSFHSSYPRGELRIMGWSMDGKVFFQSKNGFYDYDHNTVFGIYDLNENKVVWSDYVYNYISYDRDDYVIRRNVNEMLDFIIEEYKIMPLMDYTLTTIENHEIYIKVNNYEYEVGLINNNNEIHLFNIEVDFYHYLNNEYRFLTEDYFKFLFVQNPYDENLILLIVIIPSFIGGKEDGPFTYYKIFGINLNNLIE
jgi:hypothetical protein